MMQSVMKLAIASFYSLVVATSVCTLAIAQATPLAGTKLFAQVKRSSPWVCTEQAGTETEDLYYAETQNFLINICRSKKDESLLYLGVDRRNGKGILLEAFQSAKGPFVADSDNISYTVSDKELVVYQNERVILQEPVIKSFRKRL